MEQHVYFSTVFLFLNVEKTSLHISPLQDFIRNRNPSFDRSGGNCMMQKRSCAVGLNGLSCLRSQYVDRSGRRSSYILIPPCDNMKAAFCQQDFHSVRINLKLFDLFSLDSVGLNTEPDNKNRNVVCDAQTIVFFLSHLFDGILTLYVVDLQLFLCLLISGSRLP